MRKIVLFDFWDTLMKSHYYGIKAQNELFKYVINNKNNATPEIVASLYKKTYDYLRNKNSIEGPEFHYQDIYKIINESYPFEYSIPLLEREYISIHYGHDPLELTDGVEELLEYLVKEGYEVGVISNTVMSKETLIRVFKEKSKIYPFNFVIASSEAIYRKPSKHIFEIALNKLETKDNDIIYYVGDNFEADVVGSNKVGMKPIYYNWKNKVINKEEYNIDYLEIHDYKELIDYLENNKKDFCKK